MAAIHLTSDMDPRLFAKELRAHFATFATGIAIVTAAGAERNPIGITVSSFNTVSLDPPLVLFSLNRTALSLPGLVAAPAFAVNVLGHDQLSLSTRFARGGSDKWSGVPYETGLGDAPLLSDVIARFECTPYSRHDGGDHEILLGRVERMSLCRDAEPLLFFKGGYRKIATDEENVPEKRRRSPDLA